MPPRLYRLAHFLLPIPLIWILFGQFDLLEWAELKTIDWRFEARGEVPAPVNLVYVDIDEKAVQLMGEEPLPRRYIAESLDGLFNLGHIKVAGLHTIFSKASRSQLVDPKRLKADNLTLRRVIEKEKNILLGASFTYQRNPFAGIGPEEGEDGFPYLYLGFDNPAETPPPILPSEELIGPLGMHNVGLLNVNNAYKPGPEPRWLPMFGHASDRTYLTLALEIFLTYYGLDDDNVEITGDAILVRKEDGSLLTRIPLIEGQLLEVNWFSDWGSKISPHYSLADVHTAYTSYRNGTPEQKASAEAFFGEFKDAVVLIGLTAAVFGDTAATPLDVEPVPKVGLQGNVVKMLFADAYLSRPGAIGDILLTLLVAYGFAGLVLQNRYVPNASKILGALGLIGYEVLCFVLFNRMGWILPLSMPVAAALSTAFAGLVIQLLIAERKQQHIKSLFGAYVSPEIVNRIIEKNQEPQLGGTQERITAFFSDIEEFTQLSQKLEPNEVVHLMHDYLNKITAAIKDAGGTLDKFVGDSVVAMFGAPLALKNHASRACHAACTIKQLHFQLSELWEGTRPPWLAHVDTLHTRIGLCTGDAIVGNMGSDSLFDYTMMGDTVNLAARTEQLCRNYGIQVLVTQSTYRDASEQDADLAFRFIDEIEVRGRKGHVKLYELVGVRSQMTETQLKCLALYDEGMQAEKDGNLHLAMTLLKRACKLEPSFKRTRQNPSRYHRERLVHHLIEN